jgi:hypothetical protein
MSQEHLIPLKPGGDEYSDKIRSMTKGSSSPKRKIAQTISAIPKMSSRRLDERLRELVTSPEISGLQIQRLIEEVLKKDDLSNRDKISLIRVLIEKHKTLFGTQTKMEIKDNSTISDKIMQRLQSYKQQEAIKNGK